MARRKEVTTYRQEATTRVLYFSGVFAVSAIFAILVGLAAVNMFVDSNSINRGNVFGWSAAITFAIVCSILFYKVDTILNKKFNKNP